jgi:transposase
MDTPLTVITERVDDIPLLLAQLQRMDVQPLLDDYFPTHGNWQGLSLGQVTVVWLSHILSQADHRLNPVQAWVERHQETLQQGLQQPVRALDLSDDRLESVLRYLSDDAQWGLFEPALNQRQIQVYDLHPKRLRLDSTSVSADWSVNEAGLFQYGHSKDHRPDLPQLKLMLATLDPLGLPIATEIVSGQKADDPLYIPAIQQVRQTLSQSGLLYVGDSKMASLATRCFLQATGDYYLCPLGGTQLKAEAMQAYLDPVEQGAVELQEIHYDYADGHTALIAKGYEQTQTRTGEWDGQRWTWSERQLVVYSLAYAQSAQKAFQTRLEQAQTALAALNQSGRGHKAFPNEDALAQAAEAVLTRYRVRAYVQLTYSEQVEQHTVRRYRDRPARVVEHRQFQVNYTLDTEAIDQQMRTLGWRVYVTNHPEAALSLPQAVTVYRQEYLVEHSFARLKGHPLSLSPMYLQREDHIKGLMRLLSIGLRLLTLVEFQVRQTLADHRETLSGLYPGNPKRATARPTAELLLASFRDITLIMVNARGPTYAHLTELTPLQQRILQALNFPASIYTLLGPESDEPP